MSVSRWKMNRLGLVDFWCYEDDEFDFENGHMLLRGSNGSGKSVTMQSMIPLLLDGNRSSERLDPFGTRSRKMDTYLIDENSERDERIGYLYLEFKRLASDVYKTIGMGIRARKNKPLETWYFVIEDNRRVNIDFKLMENHFTLTKKQLENVLGNQVISSQKEYMQKVNDSLFGFENIDDYKDAIDLLLQLRSPKLSNSLSPLKINEILARSLQPLSEDDLRPMSEAITSMDNLQDDLQNLNTSYDAAKRINQAYDVYNKVILVDKWQKFNRENEQQNRIIKEIKDKEVNLNKIEIEYHQLQEELQKNKINLEIKQSEKKDLINPNIENMHSELVNLKDQNKTISIQITQKEDQHENKANKVIDLQNQIEKYQNEMYQLEKEFNQITNTLNRIIEDFPFSEHSVIKEALDNNEKIDFEYTKKCLKQEKNNTQNIINLFNQYDSIQEQIKDIDDEITIYNSKLVKWGQKYQNAMNQYSNCVNQYQEYFYQFSQTNHILKLSSLDIETMTSYLIDYEYNQEYMPIYNIVHNNYLKHLEQFTNELVSLQTTLKSHYEQYQTLENEYQNWLNKTDIEPVRDELTTLYRHNLSKKQIEYMPLFKLLEFDQNLDQNEKNKIEEFLTQMHLLDAIIIEEKWQELLLNNGDLGHDYYLWTKNSLNDLKPVLLKVPFDKNSLLQSLEQLGIQLSGNLDINERYFKNGILEGSIDGNINSSYIGFQSREQFRQKKLEQLKQELEDEKHQIEIIDNKINTLNDSVILLKQEMQSFKDEKELKITYLQIERTQKEIDFIQDKINQLTKHKNEKEKNLENIYQQIKQGCNVLLINVSKGALINRLENIEEYDNSLDELKNNLDHINNINSLLTINHDNLLEFQEDVDFLNAEIIKLKHNYQINSGKINNIEQQLKEAGYTDLQQKLEQLDQEIVTLQQAIEDNVSLSSTKKAEQSYNKDELNNLKEQLTLQEKYTKKYHDILMQEVQYGFIFKEDDNLFKNLKQLASKIKINKPVNEYATSLQGVFFEQASYLSQYHLTHEVNELCHEADDVTAHFIIKATYLGKKIPFIELLNILQERIESQKMLIQEEDRHIFEEILVNTIGKKIRDRIQASRRWVDKMERYIKDMNTSSGLQLTLKWQSKKSIDDDELDIQNLVKLLEKDYRILKDSDRQKISQHFRTKIENARRLSLDENISASFHQLIREVMDYRQWFEFVLYAKKPNENRKELTNRIFFAYSGGEKAISMYVPLFSAVAAKFESARFDAPHLIALDEAFAGVDENNIDNLFALITKFDFDYIMNSQVLWGDYPSCPSLAIYELFRPNNAPFVTKIAYKWNGHERRAVIK
ncbi:TIGR02680 family protein [Thomasclavelia spiroformis]|uniref:TIGR02680 family protein n=1 Tax=Thomasclavelia spiroformis TaxID=29348 RepID=UPI0026762328|nr:TIGR02680 family protein [Thomasclavelia spiroformis]